MKTLKMPQISLFRALFVLFCIMSGFHAFCGENSGKLESMPISSGIRLDRSAILIPVRTLQYEASGKDTHTGDVRLTQYAAPSGGRMNALPPIHILQGGDSDTNIEEFIMPDIPGEDDEASADNLILDIPLAAPENARTTAPAEVPDFSGFETPVTPIFDLPPDNTAGASNLTLPEGLNRPLDETTSTAQNTAAAAVPEKVPVETAGFNGVIPGKSTIQDAIKTLGKPINVTKSGGGDGVDAYDFKVEGFRVVMMHVMEGDVVFAIIADMNESMHARALARELGLQSIQSVFLSDEKGNIMGEIFPEIGVSFGYDPNEALPNVTDVMEKGMDADDMKTNVIQILFQPVTSGPFLHRAESWRHEDPLRSLADVEEALKLYPEDPEAQTMKRDLLRELAAKGISPGTTSPAPTGVPSGNTGTHPSPQQTATANTKPDTLASTTPDSDAATIAPDEMVPPIDPTLRDPLPDNELVNIDGAGAPSDQAEEDAQWLNPAEKLLEVETLAYAGEHTQALRKNQEIRQHYEKHPVLVACSIALEGDIRMVMQNPEFDTAMRCYTDAIRIATRLLGAAKTSDGKSYILNRHEQIILQKMMVDAHLSVAANVAQGKWGNKEEAVKQWLEKARQKADKFVSLEYRADSYEALLINYRVTVRSLAVVTLTGRKIDPRPLAADLMAISTRLLENVPDKKTYQLVCYETSLALDDAAQVCIQRGEYAHAIKYLQRGIAMMEKVEKTRQTKEINDTFLLGNLYYRTGFIYSLHAQYAAEGKTKNSLLKSEVDYHRSAVYYYEKAIPYMMTAVRQRHFRDQLALGEMTAGMSVSYWEVGNHARTEDLLKAGILCLEHHVAENPKDKQRLAIPYENMAQVLRYLEKPQEAVKYERKLADMKRG